MKNFSNCRLHLFRCTLLTELLLSESEYRKIETITLATFPRFSPLGNYLLPFHSFLDMRGAGYLFVNSVRGRWGDELGVEDDARDVGDQHHHQKGDDETLPGGEATLNYNKKLYILLSNIVDYFKTNLPWDGGAIMTKT